MVTYEIEHRAILTKEAYEIFKSLLEEKAQFLGEDDRQVSYHIFPDKLLKVVGNISKGGAKISLKFSELGKGSSFEEVEIPFPLEKLEDVETVFASVTTPHQIIFGTQKRRNYAYKGVEIALKWSEDWGYHAEFEIVIPDLARKEEADAKIVAVASTFGIPLMSEKEVAAFIAKVRAANNVRID